MMTKLALAAVAALGCILQASDAGACGVAYPQGSFAKFSAERSLIVWDAAKKTEHFVRSLSLKGDPEAFGVFVPTPTVPTIAKEKDDIIDHVAQLFTPPPTAPARGGGGGGGPTSAGVAPPVQVLQRVQIGDFEAVTLKATDANALGDWLAKNKFVDKPAMRTWEKTYLDKKWLITAVRCTAKGAGDRTLEVPTMRLSFVIDAPFFPYTEVPADAADEAAFQKKYGGTQTAFRGYNYGTRPFDVYVIAQTPMQGMIGASTGGPPVADAIRVSNDAVAGALGDTQKWGFDAKSQPRWVVTHLSENVWQRNAPADLSFATYDLPKPRNGPGELAMVDDRPNGPVYPASSMMWMADPTPGEHHKKNTRGRIGVIALFFLIAGAAGYAVLSEQDKKKKAKS
ncbi:MAG TPA: DUF2330 domain-containing protein [Polyangiaceae bacterium]|jgi:hypothetical protein|nr:DUF2330 domain-containing protein [Polyangiaceae bacterium]